MLHLWAFLRCNSVFAAPVPFSLSTANAFVVVVAAVVVAVVGAAADGAVVMPLLVVAVPTFFSVVVAVVVAVVVIIAAVFVVWIEVQRAFTFGQQDCVFFGNVTVASCVIFVSKRVFVTGHNRAGELPSASARFWHFDLLRDLDSVWVGLLQRTSVNQARRYAGRAGAIVSVNRSLQCVCAVTA